MISPAEVGRVTPCAPSSLDVWGFIDMAALHHFDGVMWAEFPARVATDAGIHVDLVLSVRCHGNRVNRTMLRANSAAVAIVADLILNQRAALAGRTAPLQMGFIFI